ncbi:MAG: hypothetical protein J6Y02_04035 [Pseudobutyrivibrio sp.]|nr:hypothetical protein [Pseudobutyrivibrio sp.]
MAVDPRFGNSSGYFKDPVSEEEFSPDTPRVVQAALVDGKFTWPCVMQSDGEKLLKIVFKYFTPEEKELYNAYRGRSSSGTPRPRKQKEIVSVKQETTEYNDRKVIKYNPESATSLKTLEILAQCDRCLGVSLISGIYYALVTSYNSNVVHHIPRECIPDDEFERLMCGDAI